MTAMWRVLVVCAAVLVGCSAAANPLSSVGNGPRPVDACTLLDSDQVSAIVGTPGPFTGAHEDPAEDGSPVWGCTWGTHMSYADIRELTAAQFRGVGQPAQGFVISPVSGIGDAQAWLQKDAGDGENSYVYFATAGRYYETQVCVNRYGADDAPNAPKEIEAGQLLAKLLVPHLAR